MEPTNKKKVPTGEEIPEKYVKKALKILKTGDPLKYIMDAWHRIHVGDDQIGMICCIAVISTMISNTKGLHIKPSGKSGKGKSDAIMAFLHLLPFEKKLIGSLSGKSLFYKPDLKSGTVVFSDDVKLNEDIIATIKQTTTSFQSPYTHHTVTASLKAVALKIPARMCWILTSVDGFDDEQMGNRFVSTDVDETMQQDLRVFQCQVDSEYSGIDENTIDETVLVCRAIFQQLDKETHYVSIPFLRSINWTNKDNRRNFPMFKDLIRAIAIINKFQRDKYKGSYLATLEDFKTAKKMYDVVEKTNATNLSAQGLKLIGWLKKSGPRDLIQIQEHLNIPRTTANSLLNGRERTTGGGLLSQVPGLKSDKYPQIFEKTDEKGEIVTIKTSPKWHYWYEGPMDEKSYTDVVSLNTTTLKESILGFKMSFKGVIE